MFDLHRGYSTRPVRDKGSALTVALAGTVLATAVLLALVEASGSTQQSTNRFIDDQGVYYSAQGATELAVSEVWGAYKARLATQPSLDYSTYLNSRFTWETVAPGIDPLADQLRIGSGEVKRAAVNDWSHLKLGMRIVSKFYIYQRQRNELFPGSTLVRQYNYDLMVAAESQKDLGYATSQQQSSSFDNAGTAVAEKTNAASANWAAQYLTISNPPPYKGLEYGVLTKNVQCTLCHLHVSSVEKTFNKDPRKYNTFPRVKVGSTNFMGVSSSADTVVDGTLYHRGRLEDDSSAALLDPNTAAGRLHSAVLNQNGTIKQDSHGAGTYVIDGNTSSVDSSGAAVAPAANGNFYANYPTDSHLQSDGILPNDDFPAPFPDLPRGTDNNRPNKRVDTDELDLAKADAVAYSDQNAPGSISGGVALQLAPGAQYTQNSLPASGGAAAISQSYSGNVILTGTIDNPIHIDGKVVIDGDLIIRGYVQGTGQIYTTGNVYIPGDVIYKNRFDSIALPNGHHTTQESFGLDSSNKPNLLGLVAGKNIVVGDYLSQVTTWNTGDTSSASSSNPDFFAPRKLDENNNVVVQRGNAEPGRVLTYDHDKYLNPDLVTKMPGTVSVSGKTYSKYSQPNFTMFQLAMFNQLEYTRTLKKLPDYGPGNPYDPTNAARYRVENNATNNPAEPYDPNYIPRYYSFYSYDSADAKKNPVYVATTGAAQAPISGGNGGAWNAAEKRWELQRHSADPINFTDLADIPASVQSQAAQDKKNVINVHPDWITPDNMMKIISSEEKTRQTGTRRIDGLLYTSNALLAVERKLVQTYNATTNTWSNALSRGGGNLQINGAVIAPDMGVIVPKGQFNVNYDQRVAGLLKIASSGMSTSSATPGAANAWDMTRKGFTKNTGPMPEAGQTPPPATAP